MRILLLGALFIAGCGVSGGALPCKPEESGHHEFPTNGPVWSDDATEIAAIQGAYDLRCFDDSWLSDQPTAHYENAETRIVLINPATFVRRPFGPVVPGVPRGVYDMRSAGGYLLIATSSDPYALNRMIWRMGRDGSIVGSDEPPEDWEIARAVPSPDGNTIAVALRSTISEASRSKLGSAIWFLSSAGLEARGAPIPTPSVFNEMTWTPSGELIVDSSAPGPGAARIDSSGSTDVMRPRCFHPSTTSSEIRSDGTRVLLQADKVTYVFDEDSPGSGFGCQ